MNVALTFCPVASGGAFPSLSIMMWFILFVSGLMSRWWDHPFTWETPEASRVETRTTSVNVLPDRSGVWCENMTLGLHASCPALDLCADPLVRDTHVSPQGRPSPQALLAWAPSFRDPLSQPGWLSLCLILCLVASHHPKLPTSDLTSKFSQLLGQWPILQVQPTSPVFCTGCPPCFCGLFSD